MVIESNPLTGAVAAVALTVYSATVGETFAGDTVAVTAVIAVAAVIVYVLLATGVVSCEVWTVNVGVPAAGFVTRPTPTTTAPKG